MAFLVVWVLTLAMAGASPELGQELVANGSFEQATPAGKQPVGWGWSGKADRLEREGLHWVRLADNGSVSQKVQLHPDWWKLRVSVRVRCEGVQQGREGWHDARVAMSFHDQTGKRVGPWPPVLHWTGTLDWRSESRDFVVPPGAAYLGISCSIFYAHGAVEYDDLSVKPIACRPRLEDAKLPEGVVACWDLAQAWRQETATRGRVCINGLWRFHPGGARHKSVPPPGSGWGWLKVPGRWGYNPSARAYGPDIWDADDDLNPKFSVLGWYEREVTVPAHWRSRRLFVSADNVVRDAEVFVANKAVGRMAWPAGRVDVTDVLEPGSTAKLAMRVSAMPVAADKWRAKTDKERRQEAAKLPVRGLAGDVFLEGEPSGPRVDSVLVMPSVRTQALGLRTSLKGLQAEARYVLTAEALREGKVEKRWRTDAFNAHDLRNGDHEAAFPWAAPKLWDLDRPNFYTLKLQLATVQSGVCDESTPVRFGFREFWIDGRSLMLNGRVAHLRAFDFMNPTRDFGQASRLGCEWTLRRFRGLGMNFIYLSTYDLDWGQLRYLDGVMDAADEMGFLMSICMPHPKRLRGVPEEDPKRAYWERMARWVAHKAGNHPSVIMYAMSHNSLGYGGDQNPAQLDASFEPGPEHNESLCKSRQAAAWAEDFVHTLDPTRAVYHHQCGNFAGWITLNCYLNWVPVQERVAWLSTWQRQGRKPLFLVEFGMPHHASFQRHRGAPFIWRNAVHAEPLNVEYAAMLFGDAAYDLTQANLANYDRMAQVYARKQKKFMFSEVFSEYWRKRIEKDFLDVKAEVSRLTWPAFRTWGISAVAPWDWDDMGTAREREIDVPTDWQKLQQPGESPDRMRAVQWYEHPPADSPYAEPGAVSDTVMGRTLRRLNQDLLAAIVGPKSDFTRRDHLFRPSETIEKQLALINDSPQEITFEYEWSAQVVGKRVAGTRGRARVAAGEVGLVPAAFALPQTESDATGQLTLGAQVDGASGPNLRDALAFQIVRPRRPAVQARVGLLDPAGLTARQLAALGIPFVKLEADARPAEGLSAIIVGREALRADETELWDKPGNAQAEQGLPPKERLDAPVLDRLPAWVAQCVESGKRVLVCEQSERVLSRRLGFRTAWPGTRRVFVRRPQHPVLRGLTDHHFRVWRGSSTLTLSHTLRRGWEGGNPVVDWLGSGNTRVWKWGQVGTVASVVIEKPHAGDFLPLLDCEFDLQYSPLLEYRHPSGGSVLFCQLDLSDRTEPEPVAARLWVNLVDYLSQTPTRAEPKVAKYVGGKNGEELLRELHVRFEPGRLSALRAEDLLIVGAGAQAALKRSREAVREAVRSGATVFGLCLTPDDIAEWLPVEVKLEQRQVIHTKPDFASFELLRGLGPSDFHWRGKVDCWCVAKAPEGSTVLPSGVVASIPFGQGRFVFCQAAPRLFDEQARPYLRLSRQHAARLVDRLLANCGASFELPAEADPLRLLAAGKPIVVNLAGEWRLRADPDAVGEKHNWHRPDLDDADWHRVQAPGFWEDQVPGMKRYDGEAWYRRRFRLPSDVPRDGLTLRLAAVDDEDWTYVNGLIVGHIGADTHPDNYWSAPRVYHVPATALRAGDENVIAVRVRDLRQAGGIGKGVIELGETPRWQRGLYINTPIATDDPYRYYRW